MRQIFQFSFFLFLISLVHARAAEPIVGTWTLKSQVVDGRKVETDPMTLRVYPQGDGLEFAYSKPVNGIHLVSMKFTAVHVDGREAVVQDVRGNKVGTVKITKVSKLVYTAVLEGPNHPKAVGKMEVSSDGKTLTSESGRSVQIFERH